MFETCHKEGCSKSINTFKYTCKCGKSFCIKHKDYESHSCNFDIKTFDRNLIQALNQPITTDKLINRI